MHLTCRRQKFRHRKSDKQIVRQILHMISEVFVANALLPSKCQFVGFMGSNYCLSEHFSSMKISSATWEMRAVREPVPKKASRK